MTTKPNPLLAPHIIDKLLERTKDVQWPAAPVYERAAAELDVLAIERGIDQAAIDRALAAAVADGCSAIERVRRVRDRILAGEVLP